MKLFKLSVDVFDDTEDYSEEHAALSEVPERRLVDDVLVGQDEVSENKHMPKNERQRSHAILQDVFGCHFQIAF